LKKENSFYAKIHSYGWGMGYTYANNITAQKKRIFDVSMVSIKHPKEDKTRNYLLYFDAKPYVYGKLNNCFFTQLSFGLNNIITNKPYWGGVEIRRIITVGTVLGFAKPVYLYVFDPPYSYSSPVLQKYDPENINHNTYNIYGRGPFFKGLDEIKVQPGLFLKVGLNFEHGMVDESISAVETGLMVSAFLKKIEIMSYSKNYNVFFSLYISYNIGTRSN
jgi:hypothetical protein